MVPSHGKTACAFGKNIYHNNTNLKCIYNQYSKKLLNIWRGNRGTGKNNALPSPPNHLQSYWSADPLCLPTIFLWIGK